MSGAQQGRTPANDQELIRQLVADVRELQQRSTLRMGPWAQTRDEAGRVVLANSEDGRIITLTPDPEPDGGGFLASGDPVFKASRRLGSAGDQVNATSGWHPFAANWYETIEEQPTYWQWETTTNSLTIPTRSRLLVEQSQRINEALIGDREFANVLYLNGERYRDGATGLYEDTAVNDWFQLHDLWMIDTAPGDTISWGYHSSTRPAAALWADADGRSTRVEVTEIMSR